MKVIIASDIHGSIYYANKLKERFEIENAEQLILLGDIYYHGPRNDLPKEYNPKEVAKLLNKMVYKLICLRGNCDGEVDEMISDFAFSDSMYMLLGGKKIYLSHGHKLDWDNPSKYGQILIYGHLHTGFIKNENGITIVNTGSVSLPKDGTKNSYIVMTDNKIELKDLEGNLLGSEEI